jgi:hypothetical protein
MMVAVFLLGVVLAGYRVRRDWRDRRLAAEGEIALAESNRRRAEDRVIWARKMLAKGYVSRGQVVSEELALKRAKFDLQQARAKRTVLERYMER